MEKTVNEAMFHMTDEEKWANVNDLAMKLPKPDNKQEHISFAKSVAETYFEWFPQAEYMIEHNSRHGSILLLAGDDGKVCQIYELGDKVFEV